MGGMFEVRPARCPIAPPHASLPPCLQPAASAPHAAPEQSSPPPLRTWQGASSFNQPLDWDVARVTSMYFMFYVRPEPLPHRATAHAPPALPAARHLCTPRTPVSIPCLPLSAPGSTPPASTSPWTGTSRKSRTWDTCSMYARAAAPSRRRTRASRLGCSPPPPHPRAILSIPHLPLRRSGRAPPPLPTATSV